MTKHHDKLSGTVQNLPMDYDPWGKVVRWSNPQLLYPDCSHGCIHFYPLATRNKERLGNDWGVCANPQSHRNGLLTFEHQGCQQAERRASPVSSKDHHD